MIFGKSIVFPTAMTTDSIMIKCFVLANRADDDRVILIVGSTNGWQYSLTALSTQGGINAFFHNLSLKSVFGGGLTKPFFCILDAIF